MKNGASAPRHLAWYYANGKIDKKDIKMSIEEWGAKNRLMKCGIESETSPRYVVYVESIGMRYFKDTIITTPRKCSVNDPICARSNTTQEFLFQEYFKDDYPDLILIPRNSHDIRLPVNMTEIESVTKYVVQIVTEYVPNTTTAVWLSEIAEYDARRPEKFKGQRLTQLKWPFHKSTRDCSTSSSPT